MTYPQLSDLTEGNRDRLNIVAIFRKSDDTLDTVIHSFNTHSAALNYKIDLHNQLKAAHINDAIVRLWSVWDWYAWVRIKKPAQYHILVDVFPSADDLVTHFLHLS